MTDYEILPSKLNTHSLEELDMYDPNTFGVLIDKILHIAIKPTKLQQKEIFKIAASLANNDSGTPNNNQSYKSYVRQDRLTKSWIAARTIQGIRHKKVNKSKELVEDWYKELCLTYNIKP